MRLRLALYGVCVPLALAVACGGGDDDDGGGSAGAGTTSVGGSAGSSGGGAGGTSGTPAGTAGAQNVMCDPAGDGTCENDTDCPKVESGEARMSAQSCGLGCLQSADQEMCAVECIVDDVAISEGCAACYAAAVKCAADHCLAQCASDPTSQACSDCQAEEGCRSAFDTCSGLPPQD